MIDRSNAYKSDLHNTFLGEVMEVEDPLFKGRIKVKVFGKFDDIPLEDLPWSHPGMNSTGGSDSGGGFFSVPKVGSIVSIKFDQGNIYHPEYFFHQEISDEVKTEIEASYPNAHVLVYDTVTEGSLKIFFTEAKGLMLDYKESQINIKPDKSIIIQNASGDGILEMLDDGTMNITQANMINITTDADINVVCQNLIVDHAASVELGAGATEHLVLGEKMMALFNAHQHIGNLGAPTSPPTKPMTPSELSQKEVKTL
tara:strand:- start:3493 stop:4260 length:768 start_codon:yes stop_codon:yes gene_type:complete